MNTPEALRQDIATLQTIHETKKRKDPQWIHLQETLANQYATLCGTTGEISDLNAAIEQFRRLLENIPRDHPGRFDWHWHLGRLYHKQYKDAKAANSLDLATHHYDESLQNTANEHPDLAERIWVTGSCYYERFQETSNPEDWEAYVQRSQKAVYLTQRDDPARLDRVQILAMAHSMGYETTKQLDDVEKAIPLYQEALDMMPKVTQNSASRAMLLRFLASSYESKYEITKTLTELDASITFYEQAAELCRETSGYDSSYALQLGSNSRGYWQRFTSTGALADIDKSIQLCKDALDLTHDHLNRPELVEQIANYYQDRYYKTGVVADIDLSIKFSQEALEMVSDDLPTRARWLHSLSASNFDRYSMTEDLEDLEASIQYLQEAIRITPTGHPDHQDHLQTLGRVLNMRFLRTQAMADLELCILHYTEVTGLYQEDDLLRGLPLIHLSAAFRCRHSQTRVMSDLEMSIKFAFDALAIILKGTVERALCCSGLSKCYAEMSERTDLASDFDAAVQWSQEALNSLPESHPDPGAYYETAGLVHRQRFNKTAAILDADAAIELHQKALDSTSDDDGNRPKRLGTLASAYWDRYTETASASDADISIQHYEEALDLTPDNHPDRGRFLYSLHLVYRQRYIQKGAATDFKMLRESCREAFDHSPSLEVDRVSSGRAWFDLLVDDKNWLAAHQTAIRVMALIPQLTPRSLQNSDKQSQLGQIVGFASKAAAVALLESQSAAFEAIQLLELGRGIIIGSLGELRSDVSDLLQEHPVVAEEYLRLRDRLDGPITPESSIDRPDLAKKFEELLREIRERPGFERFLLPLSEESLKVAAAWGPVVIINVDRLRCDALVIEEDQIQCLPLRHLRYEDVEARARSFSCSTMWGTGLLEWLWDTIAEPVLGFLDLNEAPTKNWPRIWWIPVGPLAKLPIHAAGRHDEGSHNTVLDRVMSSYSSSVKALIHSRQADNDAAVEAASNRAVLIGMEVTPGQNSLAFVSGEINKVASLCGELQLQTVQPQPTREEVLSAIQGCSIFHFAGHGRNDALDPSHSALLLSDGALTVNSLFETNLHAQKPVLAYLSACGTGQIRHDNSVDEGLHLISACQLAGFRHVIGSLCEVEDKACEEFATSLYRWMKDHGMGDRSICEGLHQASRKLRDQWASDSAARDVQRRERESSDAVGPEGGPLPDGTREARTIVKCDDDLPLYWAPYVHFGA